MKRGSVGLLPLFSLVWFVGVSSAVAGALEEGKAAFDARDYQRAIASFSEGVKASDAASAYYLARMLELGLGVTPDMTGALRLYRQAAEGLNVDALNRLALMHYRGEAGVPQNYGEAARLFDQAATKGNANALFNLGRLYFEGKGVPRDLPKAIEFYRLAAQKDHILALNTLGALYRAGSREGAERNTARSYFARSASFGNAVGLYETARMILEDGTDPAHMVEAHMYLNLASARMHPNAPQALQELTALMSLDDVAKAQSLAKEKAPGFLDGTTSGSEP